MPEALHPMFMGVDVFYVATLLLLVGVIAMMAVVYLAYTSRDPMAKRVKQLNERREQLKAGIVAPATKRRAKLVQKNETTDRMRSILASLQVLQDTQIKETQAKLMQAGIRSKDTAYTIIFLRMVLPIVLGGGVAIWIFGFGGLETWDTWKRGAIACGALWLSYKAPDLWVDNKVGSRTKAIKKGVPDALDLLVICAEAGLTVDTAFQRVARELGKAYPELGDEFMLTSIELSFLAERRQAFENLAKRVKLEALKGVVTTMIQTEKYGTPLASALRVLSAEFRHNRMMAAEEKAARLPALMSVPLILFILPTLFIVVIGPASCRIYAQMFSGGH